MNFSKETIIGIAGSGIMGTGIAQVAAMAGYEVVLSDQSDEALIEAKKSLVTVVKKLQEKGKIENADAVLARIQYGNNAHYLKECGLVIEAITEKPEAKKAVFEIIEKVVNPDCVIATNTSSLSVTSIAANCKNPSRVMGLHFFNPAPLMALVEIIPAIQTDEALIPVAKELMQQWGKIPVIAKDTPGFIVNRVARPFYSEAIRIMEEGIADMATIDWAMTAIGGFRMGPFTLMDYIGHDVNYVVTETVFTSFFYDPRYKPSFSQKRLLEAGWLGRKNGRGFYNYADGAAMPEPIKDEEKGKEILERILAMIINEAVDALYLGIASAADLDLAMTKGVNYPKGLLKWCDEWGAEKCLGKLDELYENYREDRYRASILLRKHTIGNKKFV